MSAWDSGGNAEGGSYATQGQLMGMQGRLATVERQLQTAFAQISNLPTGQSRADISRAVEKQVEGTVDDVVASLIESKMGETIQQFNSLMTTLNSAMQKRIKKQEDDLLDASMQT